MTADEIFRRAGGRRAYNTMRRWQAKFRQLEVIKICRELEFKRGWQAEAARRLDVSSTTISRDYENYMRGFWNQRRSEERDERIALERAMEEIDRAENQTSETACGNCV